jgi:putative ATPase
MKGLDYGGSYRYAHDEPGAYAAGESYLPERLKDRRWYLPVDRGLEDKIRQKFEQLRSLDAASARQRYPDKK